jgi:Tfp pilus assembly protein PilN
MKNDATKLNETQATGIPMNRDELELAGRTIPKAKRRYNSLFVLLEKFSRTLWKYLSFSLADNFFTLARVICISVEHDGIYIVYGKKSFSKIAIKYFKKFPLEENKHLTPEHLASVMSVVADELKDGKARYVLCLPKSWAIVQTAEFPVAVKENLSNVVSYELDRLTPLTANNAFYDYKQLWENQEKLSILLAVAKADQIKPYLDALQAKGIFVGKLNISSFVIVSLIQNTYKNVNSVFISFNDKFYECGVIINNFTIRTVSGVVEKKDDSPIDYVIRQTYPLFNLLTGCGSPVRIVVNTSEQNYKKFQEKLSKFPLFNLDRDVKLNTPKGDKELSYNAVGGFLETVIADKNDFNLLSKKNDRQNKTPFLSTIILSVIIFLIGAFYIVAPIVIEQKKVEEIDSHINSLKPEMKKIDALKKEIEFISADIDIINNFKKQSTLSMVILKELTSILPEKTWLTRVRITENNTEIEGYAASATAIIPKLENSKYFQKAEFASPTFRDPRQNNERFVIRMELKNENKPRKPEEVGKKNEKKK